MAGSVVRELRGGRADRRRAQTSARGSTSRSRARAQSRRAPQRTRARGQAKRTSTGARAKAQPKRATTRARAKPQPKRQPQRKPLDDAAIAQKVEATIFQGSGVDGRDIDVEVTDGTVSLRGEVSSRELGRELEARATGVSEVRSVQNQLRVRETPSPEHVDLANRQQEATPPAGVRAYPERTPAPANVEERRPAPAVRTSVPAKPDEQHASAPLPDAAGTRSGSETDSPAERAKPEEVEADNDRTGRPNEPSG
ncbi:MAG TPA: BON domain-containing protein [Thermoleophilaceae bacterium]